MSTLETAEGSLQNANREFLDKNYKSAMELYNLSIELDDSISDAFLKRALCQEKLKNYADVVEDLNQAIALDPMNLKAYYQKGITSYEIGDTQTALESFEKCLALDSSDSMFPTWVEKCKSRKSTKGQGPKPAPPKATPTPAPAPKSTPTPTPTPSTTSSSASSSSASSSSSSSSSSSDKRPPAEKRPAAPPRPPAPKAPKAPRAPKYGSEPEKPKPEPVKAPEPVKTEQSAVPLPPPTSSKYNWVQTDNFIVVTIFVKNAKPAEVSIDFEERSLSVNVQLSTDNQFLLDLDLANEINKEGSIYEIMSTKIEIKLKKAHPVKWSTLERKEPEAAPAAKKETKNWDKIMAGEELDKDTSFNQLMRDMYSCASEEERRAMMKSFHESGGTVLSADWKDVGKGNVDPKPPVGVTKWEKDL